MAPAFGDRRFVSFSLSEPAVCLSLFLIILFFTGGSSASDVWQLSVLRPVAILCAARGLYGMRAEHWQKYWLVWALFGGTVVLILAQLVPLPYSWWTQLPGRGLIADIDAAVGFGKIARPISMQPEATTNALISMSVPLAVLALSVQLNERQHRNLASFLLALIALSAIFGLLQLSGKKISFYSQSLDINPAGLFNNRNHQSALLAMIFPLSALAWLGGYGWDIRAGFERFCVSALSILIIPLLVVTGSRTGLLIAAMGLSFVLISVPLRQTASSRRFAMLSTCLGVLAVVAFLAWLTIYAGRDVAFERFAIVGDDSRFPLWHNMASMIQDYWPWGTGIGTFVEAFQILEPDSLLAPEYWNHAHNEWLEILLTTGLPGLILLLLALASVLAGLVKLWRSNQKNTAMAQIGFAIVIMLAIASTTDYPVHTPIHSGILALASVWAARGVRVDKRARNA